MQSNPNENIVMKQRDRIQMNKAMQLNEDSEK